jgi:chorismate mutase-like protein
MSKQNGVDLFQRLKGTRRKIDLIDRKLLNLVNQRFSLAQEIGRIKKEMGAKIYDPKREKKVLEGLVSKNRGPLKEEDLRKIFRTMIKVCRKSQI